MSDFEIEIYKNAIKNEKIKNVIEKFQKKINEYENIIIELKIEHEYNIIELKKKYENIIIGIKKEYV